MNRLTFLLVVLVAVVLAPSARAQSDLEPGSRVMLMGNTFGERWAMSGYFEALVHAAHPGQELTVRSFPWSGDEVALRPRELNVPTTLDHLGSFDPDVVVMCYGMVESFKGKAGVEQFERELGALCETVRAREGDEPRRLVLVSPIRHEDLGGGFASEADVAAHNASIADYVAAIHRVAEDTGSAFIDLFDTQSENGLALTSNGVHPSDYGCFAYAREFGRQIGWIHAARHGEMNEAGEAGVALADSCADKFWYERLIYRPTNTEYVWGRRHEPFGVVNFPEEFEQLERMVAARTARIRAMDLPEPGDLFAEYTERDPVWPALPLALGLPEDYWTPTPVEAKGTETSLGSLEIKPSEEFLSTFTVADGYEIECFASEEDFEELANPLALTFDTKHRLWVLVAPTYPHLMPGDAPRCKLIILEDTDGNGRADKRTIFADRLYIPTGFAIDSDAVYIGQSPDLLRLRDLDGDDHADTREIVATGFAMPDSHHQISAFEWDPAGGIMLHEGVFSNANVETPYGVRRTRDAAVWRFDPRTERLEVMSHCGFANPWGHAFDDYGQSMLADASGGDNFSFSHVIHAFTYPRKPGRPGPILNRGRPTAGAELVASRQFPPEAQDTFLVNQSIGFHGTRWDRLIESGSSWRAEHMPQDLVQSSDANFRPVAMEIGPDGALYLVDWCNPLIGHMQYSTRDPRRDHAHGRIWRIKYSANDLLTPPNIEGESVQRLLSMLRLPERNTRQLARRKLQTTDPNALLPALRRWLTSLDAMTDPMHDRLWLEALWIHQATGRVDQSLLERVAQLQSPYARAGAIRVVRHWLVSGDLTAAQAAPILERAANDDDMHVRLEAVIACGWLNPDEGIRIASLAADLEMDSALNTVLRETLIHLAPGAAGNHPLVRRLRLEQLPVDKLAEETFDPMVGEVMLGRSDVPIADRIAAAERLGGEAVAPYLLAQLGDVRRESSAGSLSEVVLALPSAEVAGSLSALRTSLKAENESVRAHAAALIMREAPDDTSLRAADPDTVLAGAALLEPGEAPPAVITRLREQVRSFAESRPVMEQIVRHTPPEARSELASWLRTIVDAGIERPLDWSLAQGLTMAAARALAEMGEPGPVEAASPEVMALGREVFLDEAIGCARCHAPHGRGLEGFPPLDRSPWVLGGPQRVSAIALHGLYGEIVVPGKMRLTSSMAPLGLLMSDEQAAAAITYVRQSWGNFAPAVEPATIAAARHDKPESGLMWTTAAILERYPFEHEGAFGRLAGAPPAPTIEVGGSTQASTAPATSDSTQAASGSGTAAATAARVTRGGVGGPSIGIVPLFLAAGAVFVVVVIGAAWAFRKMGAE